MIVAIHQPNYAPWLGYFHKIARADVLVFLDDAQFSKNGYINRVQILAAGKPRWLSVPVSFKLGEPINQTRPARTDWPAAHLDTLRTFYRSAACFKSVWDQICEIYREIPSGFLDAANRWLIERFSAEIGLACRFQAASDLPLGPAKGDDRLIAIVQQIDENAIYLSGKGGAKYQDPAKFKAAGIELRYTDFVHPVYDQGGQFVPGLSILDAVFHLGWDRTRALVGAEHRQ
jgi:hypothetical protein